MGTYKKRFLISLSPQALGDAGFAVVNKGRFFDTIVVDVSPKGQTAQGVQDRAAALGVNVRVISDRYVGLSFGEAVVESDVTALLQAFGGVSSFSESSGLEAGDGGVPAELQRESKFMTHPVFNTHHSETQMLRYVKHLENMDLALNTSMISLGSCTMKVIW
jgi:glycine dehydrogenase